MSGEITLRNIRITIGAFCVIIGLAALYDFDWILNRLMFLSADGQVVPLMKILLQLCLTSLIIVGVVLILYGLVIRLLAWSNVRISRPDTRTFLMYALLAGFVLRLAAVLFMPFNQFFDYAAYDQLGWEWAQKGGFYNGEHLTAYWPPGYPFFLSRIYLLFGHVPEIAAAANILLSLSIPLLTYFIIRKIWTENLARWTATILILLPSQILFTHLLASEIVFTPLLLLSMLLFLSFDRKLSGRWYKILAGGVILGLATLTRVISKLFLVMIIPFWLWESREIKSTVKYGVLALLGFAIVVVPWMMRNESAVGVAKINTNTGINFFIGNQPGSGMGYNKYLADEYEVNNPLYEAYVDSSSWNRGLDYIVENPGTFLYRGVIKVGYFYATDVDPVWFGLMEAADQSKTNYAVILGFLVQSYYLLVLLAASIGVWLFFRSDRSVRNPGGFLLLAIILYWTGIHFVFYGMGRYHFPIMPMICAFAALFIKSVVDKSAKTC